jgi:hypothetical protein
MPTTSPSALSGWRSRENFLPPPRLTLLNLPPRPRPPAEDITGAQMCVASKVAEVGVEAVEPSVGVRSLWKAGLSQTAETRRTSLGCWLSCASFGIVTLQSRSVCVRGCAREAWEECVLNRSLWFTTISLPHACKHLAPSHVPISPLYVFLVVKESHTHHRNKTTAPRQQPLPHHATQIHQAQFANPSALTTCPLAPLSHPQSHFDFSSRESSSSLSLVT